MTSSADFVTLKPGRDGFTPTVPVAVLQLLWRLEDSGFRVEANGPNVRVSPGAKLTDEDRAALVRWKPHVLCLLEYEPPPI